MVLIKSVFIFSFLITCVSTLNNTSPCPRLFVYEQNTSLSNRWYGTVTLLSDIALEGVWLRLIFDRELQQIGNWFGEVRADHENTEFLIKNRNYKLKANTPYPIRFYAQYDENRPIPRLVSIKLNSIEVCPEENLNTRTTVTSHSQSSEQMTIRTSTVKPLNNTSPCPRLFVYEQNTSLSNRWYGTVTLLSDIELEGVWLRLIFDRELQQIGNWFGEVRADHENTEFLIKNRNYKLKVNTPYPIRFYAQYDENRPVPRLVSIKLNSIEVCPEENLNTRTTVTSHSQSSEQMTIRTSTVKPLNNTSPCPRLFVYEQNTSLSNRWYGTVTLLSDIELEGVWLRLIFDRELQQIGNWFGEVRADHENTEFLIKNRNYKLKANTPYPIRFYAQYDENRPVPRLVSFKLNSIEVCLEENLNTRMTVTSHSQSSEQITIRTSTVKPSTTRKPNTPLQISDDDDYFISDFGVINPNREQSLSSSSLDECRIVAAQPKVLNSDETVEGQFPWHANVYHTNSADLVLVGGGTLISKEYVLTAGHCLYENPSTNILPDDLLVYLGKYNSRSFSSLGIQDRTVCDIVFHPQFNSTTSVHNLAMLKLSVPVTLTDYVRPICLWQGENVDKEGVIVGWGVDEFGKHYSKLTRAEMQIVSKELCYPISDDTFCTIFRSGTSVCNADAGGGYLSARKTIRGDIWYLRGVLSVVKKGTKCDPFKYTSVTDITSYWKWIKYFI